MAALSSTICFVPGLELYPSTLSSSPHPHHFLPFPFVWWADLQQKKLIEYDNSILLLLPMKMGEDSPQASAWSLHSNTIPFFCFQPKPFQLLQLFKHKFDWEFPPAWWYGNVVLTKEVEDFCHTWVFLLLFMCPTCVHKIKNSPILAWVVPAEEENWLVGTPQIWLLVGPDNFYFQILIPDWTYFHCPGATLHFSKQSDQKRWTNFVWLVGIGQSNPANDQAMQRIGDAELD